VVGPGGGGPRWWVQVKEGPGGGVRWWAQVVVGPGEEGVR
jgi:hypothetical protein